MEARVGQHPQLSIAHQAGTWDLKLWKRLGVESSSFDKAYVSVSTNSGGW